LNVRSVVQPVVPVGRPVRVSLARVHDASYLVTTDRDFESLCDDEPFQYRNPIPADELDGLSNVDG
jgi:hypothetical protein